MKKSRTLRFGFFAGFVMASSLGFAQNINEVLGRPTDNAITVSVLVDAPVDVYVEYGTTQGTYPNSTQATTSSPDNPVDIEMTGLQAETRYYYRTRFKASGQSTYQIGAEHTFITQRKKGSSFSFTVESDCHPYDKKGYHPLLSIALQNQLNNSADFMIDMGDTFGDDHNPTTITSDQVKQLQLNCRELFGEVCHSMPLFFCIGNHEGESGYYLLQTPPNNLATYETTWRKKFYPNPSPNAFYSGNTESEGNGMENPENYYAWEWGDALFVVLDVYRYATATEKPQKWDFTIGKTQYDWFKQTLETSSAKYKFVFCHHVLGQGRGGVELAGLYEWGGTEGKGVSTFAKNRPDWAMPLHQLMKENKVDVLFQGHDHIYVRQELDSVIYQTVPMPSDSSYKIGITDNGDAFKTGVQLGGSGHLRINVTPDSATVDYISAVLPQDETAELKNGQVVYSYSIVKTTDVTSSNNEIAKESKWNIYPNPASANVDIILDKPLTNESMVQLLSIDGRLVMQANVSKNSSKIHLDMRNSNGNSVAPGLYMVKLNDGNGNISCKRLVVK